MLKVYENDEGIYCFVLLNLESIAPAVSTDAALPSILLPLHCSTPAEALSISASLNSFLNGYIFLPKWLMQLHTPADKQTKVLISLSKLNGPVISCLALLNGQVFSFLSLVNGQVISFISLLNSQVISN
jgi:hypothetical protein